MWCRIINEFLVGPYFFKENPNGNKYSNFLKHDLPIFLENIPLQQHLDLIWQQDSAPAYNTLVVFAHMQEIYRKNWFGTHSHHILI